MLAMPALWWVWVLAVVCLVCTAHHLLVVAVQLVVVVFAGNVTQPQRLALFCEFLVGQRVEATQCACNAVKNAHAQMLSHLGATNA